MRKKGTLWMFLGVLLLLTALGLTIYNLYEAKRAHETSKQAVEQLMEAIRAEETNEIKTDDIPEYVTHPDKEMPMMLIGNTYYIGILEIPDLGISLPVIGGEWSYNKLLQAPCRYSGSVYKDNLVIAAHNYDSHFGNIHHLESGSDVYFIDTEGHVFEYEVGWLDTLKPSETEVMKDAKDWDLSLFTCTYSGQERYTIRCIKKY